MMSITYRNRKGDVYYLLQGKTPKGRPKYYFSRKPGENSMAAIPKGYEIYEKPEGAQVFLRRITPSAITAQEHAFVLAESRRVISTGAVLVDVENDSLIVYHACGDERLLHMLFGDPLPTTEPVKSWAETHGEYTKTLRFTLVDKERRLFTAERWCFLGSIDDWVPLSGPSGLEELVPKYARHLGQESFFELM
jgi:hypothetical protein